MGLAWCHERVREWEWEEKEEKKKGSQGSFVFVYKSGYIRLFAGECIVCRCTPDHSAEHVLLFPPQHCSGVIVNGNMSHPLWSPEDIFAEVHIQLSTCKKIFFQTTETTCRLHSSARSELIAKWSCSTTSPLGGSVGRYLLSPCSHSFVFAVYVRSNVPLYNHV